MTATSVPPADTPRGLWAIACYFNPMGFRSRLANYRTFRRHLTVPLLTVEQGYGGRFELDARDATILVQVPGRDVLWQKERLLNLALEHLPAECDTVVWLDADILFERDDWPQRATDALEAATMVQLFSRTCYLPREVDFSRPLVEQRYLERRSTASGLVGGGLQENPLGATQAELRAHGLAIDYANGHAWAMRRDLLQPVGFYEAFVVGGGDYVFLQAALGQFEAVRSGHEWARDSRQYTHFLRWARKLHEVVQGRIGMVPGDLFNLWHGELLDRGYRPRHRILRAHDFDPDRDIAIDEHGSLCWSSDKPALHQAVREYFESRREDGRR